MDGWIGLSGCGKWMESGSGLWIVESGAVPDLTPNTVHNTQPQFIQHLINDYNLLTTSYHL